MHCKLMLSTVWLKLALAYNIMSESWAVISRGTSEPRCVPIPLNLTLCQGLEYSQMRLPNNLDHETLFEVTEQAAAWVNLLNLNCHSDAKLFLCSLFAPVCLPRFMKQVIKPCQSLCLDVKKSCAPRMAHYGFSWPDMLKCDKFPAKTGMCIQPRRNYGVKAGCKACNEVDTFENILDNFCRSTHVFRAKLKQRMPTTGVVLRRGRAFKPANMSRSSVRSLRIQFKNRDCRCNSIRKGEPAKKYLIMASEDRNNNLKLNLLMPWNIRKKTFKRAVRLFRKIDCSRLGEAIMRRARRNRARLFQRNVQYRRQGQGRRHGSQSVNYSRRRLSRETSSGLDIFDDEGI